MSRRRTLFRFLDMRIFCLAIAAVMLVPCVALSQTDGPIVVGAVVSLSGRDAAFGRECLAGLTIAIEEANAQGGVHGLPLKIESYDDKSDPIFAAEGVRTLANQINQPVAIIGSSTSMVTSAAAVAAQQVEVPLVVPEATNPAITSIGDWIYRVCFVDPDMAAGLAIFAYNNLGLRRVAIIQEERHDYTQSLSRYFKKEFTDLGGEIVLHMGYPAGRTDFDDVLVQVKKNRADAVFVSGFYPEAGAIMATAIRHGLDLTFLGGDGWESSELFDIAGDAINDDSKVYIASHFSPDVKRSKVRGFVMNYDEKEGHRPNTSSALGYDAGGVVIEAIERAKTPTRKNVRDALLEVRHEGVTGRIIIDKTRNTMKKVIVLRARPDHTFAFVNAVSPHRGENGDGAQP